MEIYTVTYCAMDEDTTAPLPWHACILLSRYDEATKKMKVVDHWGFYGLPTTSSNSILRSIKIKIGLDVDLTGNHGMLRHEDTRYLDIGRGLHGITFELTAEKFKELQDKCNAMVKDQRTAINSIIESLNLTTAVKLNPRIYEYEHLSYHIFALEKEKAKLENRAPKLNEFKLGNEGVRTCKVQMVDLLRDVITPEQLANVIGYHQAIPRLSWNMERIYLHSVGTLHDHTKKSGKKVYYRDQKLDKDVDLYWTFPPQNIDTLSDETRRLFKVRGDLVAVDDVKAIISRLQRLEWFFLNTTFDASQQQYRTQLLAHIHALYEAFSVFTPKAASTVNNSWSNSLYSMFVKPKDPDEVALLEKYNAAKDFIERLDSAVVDEWEVDEYNPEALAAYLSEDDRDELYSIIGPRYTEEQRFLT